MLPQSTLGKSQLPNGVRYYAACDDHADEREAIRREVLMEDPAKYGADFGASMGGRWAIGHTTLTRFAKYMAEQHGVSPPRSSRLIPCVVRPGHTAGRGGRPSLTVDTTVESQLSPDGGG